MLTVSIAPPAGWYPDPLGEPVLRWWGDGGWTEHTALDENAVPDGGFHLQHLPAPDPSGEGVVPEPSPVAWTDWTAVARRVRELAVDPHPRIAHLRLGGDDPIVLDTRYRAYGWTRPLSELPRWRRDVDILLLQRAPLAPTVFSLRSGPIEDLVAALDALGRR